MTEQAPDLDALLVQIDNAALPAADRWRLGKQAEHIAEGSGDAQQLYAIRMRLVGLAHLAGHTGEHLTAFLWCAYTHDGDPLRYPARPIAHLNDVDLLWWYRWHGALLLSWPEYSLAQIHTALDMMQAAYRRAGAGEAGVLWAQFQVAYELGDLEQARAHLEQIALTEPDEYSNCEACSMAAQVSLLFDLGESEKALEVLDRILAGQHTCTDQPEAVISASLIHLLHAGRIDQARALQERTYPEIMSLPGHLGLQCDHMLFFLATGNPARAYELLGRHLTHLWHEGQSPGERFNGLVKTLRVASLIAQTGRPHLPLRGTEGEAARTFLRIAPAAPRRATPIPLSIGEFITLARERALELADAFDARSGTTRAREAVLEATSAELPAFPLDLGGARFADDALGDATLLTSAHPTGAGTFRDWVELALEMQYMNGVEDSEAVLLRAVSVASTPKERYEALVMALQHEDLGEFTPVHAAFVALMRELGHDTYAEQLERYGWKLWRDTRPADVPEAADPPFLDAMTELRHATSPMWRMELALLLLEDVAVATSAMFDRWEAAEGCASEAERERWNRDALALLEEALAAPPHRWEEQAEEWHERLGRLLDRGRVPGWDFLMVYALVYSRITGQPYATHAALRAGNDYFTHVPPPYPAVLRFLEVQGGMARASGVVAGELTALWGLTTIAMHAGTERKIEWDERIAALASEVRHPYLAARLRIDASVTASALGDVEGAVRWAKLALVTFDRAEAWRARMSASERAFLTRSRILELLFTYLHDAGNMVEALATGRELIAGLRQDTDARERERRLVEALQSVADIMASDQRGDIAEAQAYIAEALDLLEARSPSERTHDEALLLSTDVLMTRAHLACHLEDAEACRDSVDEAVQLLELLGTEWAGEASERFARLAEIAERLHPRLADRLRLRAGRLAKGR
ncbi:MAG: hypothetical protein Q4G21_03150 [Dermabacter sp.]|nr:hypothetical protein [Dermabacter sp.]